MGIMCWSSYVFSSDLPVIRDADQLSFAGIEKTISDLGKRARDGKLGIDELQGGSFSITNGGVFGSLMSTPIINPPQSAIQIGRASCRKAWVSTGRSRASPGPYIKT